MPMFPPLSPMPHTCPHCGRAVTDTLTAGGFVLTGCAEYILQKLAQLSR